MGKHTYRYLGQTDVHLPQHGLLAKGADPDAAYETDQPINHPDFAEVTQEVTKRKESKQK